MVNLPFDIILDIFYKIDDFNTLNNMSILNKATYENLKYYNKVKIYKVQVLADELFEYLYKFPMNENKLKLDKSSNVLIVYTLYKNFIYSEMEKYFGTRYSSNIGPSLTNIILIQGKKYINDNIEIYMNDGKIALRSKKRTIINNFDTSFPFKFLKDRMLMFESIIALR